MNLKKYLIKNDSVLNVINQNKLLGIIFSIQEAIIDSIIIYIFAPLLSLIFVSNWELLIREFNQFLLSITIISILEFIRYCFTKYIFSKKGIYKISGIIFKNVTFISYNEITGTTTIRNSLQKLLGIKTIKILGNKKTISIKDIDKDSKINI